MFAHPLLKERGLQPGDTLTISSQQTQEFLDLPFFCRATEPLEKAKSILGYDHGVTIVVEQVPVVAEKYDQQVETRQP